MQNDLPSIDRDLDRMADHFCVSIDQTEIGRAVALLGGDPAQSSFPFRICCRINKKCSFIIRQCRTDFVSPMIFCSWMGERKRPLHYHTAERQSRFLSDDLTCNR